MKERAKNSIKIKDYPSALKLYSRCIEIGTSTLSEGELSVIYGNRSMVELAMGKASDAFESASLCLTHDKGYVKGYYRKAMAELALKKYLDSKSTLLEGLSRQPDEKELLLQLKKVEDLIANSASDATGTVKTAASTLTSSVSSSTSSISGQEKSTSCAPKPSSASSSSPSNVVEEDLDASLIRGYKIRSDGKKTTFFNHELDDSTKQLIGDIAPKRVNDPSIVEAAPTLAGASAWNAAGTWEERNLTTVANNKLRDLVSTFESTFVELKLCAKVEKAIETLEGDAQVTMMRGKKKLIYDYTLTFPMSLYGMVDDTESASSNDSIMEIQVNIVDITADMEHEIQLKLVTGASSMFQAIRPSITQAVEGLLHRFHEFLKTHL